MNLTLLSQTSEGGAHFLAVLQSLHRQLVNLATLFAELKTLVDLVGRNNHYAIYVCNNEISRVDCERLCLLWRCEFDGDVQSCCSGECV